MSDDSLNRVVIQTIKDMTTELHAVRSDVNRAVGPLYQRIVSLETSHRRDSAAREARQSEVDDVLSEIRMEIQAVRKEGVGRGWQAWAQMGLLSILAIGVIILIILLWRMIDHTLLLRIIATVWR